MVRRIKFKRGKNYNIKEDKEVKVIKYNNGEIIVKESSKKPNNLKRFKKINANEYMDIETGEIKQYRKREKRKIESIKNARKKLMHILKNNFDGSDNELYITVTCEEQEEDYNKMHKMIKQFFTKLKNIYKGIKYVYVIELQEERNSWHMHGLIKDKMHEKLYIDNEEIAQIWGHGYTKTLRIKDVEQENEIANCKDYGENAFDNIEAIDKVILYMAKTRTKEKVPVNKNLYYTSKNIERPKTEKMLYKNFKKEVEGIKERIGEETTLVISTYTDEILNKHKKEYWADKKGEDKK